MTTTLTLVDTIKIDTRRNGDVSYAKVKVVLDGIPTDADFRCKVGEEAIVIDGDTISVSDAQVEELRKGVAIRAAAGAAIRAAQEQALAARIAKADAWLDQQNASDDARAELHAHIRAFPHLAAGRDSSLEKDRFEQAYSDILTRHGLV